MTAEKLNLTNKQLLGLFICVCIAMCTTVAHITAKNRPDTFYSYPPDNHHCSDDVYLRKRGPRWHPHPDHHQLGLNGITSPGWQHHQLWLAGTRSPRWYPHPDHHHLWLTGTVTRVTSPPTLTSWDQVTHVHMTSPSPRPPPPLTRWDQVTHPDHHHLWGKCHRFFACHPTNSVKALTHSTHPFMIYCQTPGVTNYISYHIKQYGVGTLTVGGWVVTFGTVRVTTHIGPPMSTS